MLREGDELGRVSYYTLNGMWLGKLDGLCEIIEELGTFNSEFELRLLLRRRPAVYAMACEVCGGSVLVVVEEGGGLVSHLRFLRDRR